ncbi:MAG: Hint domain-containing protein [Bdellovibrionota bacterium]
MKHGTLGPKNQGSMAFAAVASLMALGLGFFYTMNSSRQTQNAIDQALALQAAELGETSNLSNFSLLRGLMADRIVPGQKSSLPAVYPEDYFSMSWDLQKNKSYSLPSVEAMANRVKVRSFAPGEATIDSVKAIFDGSKTQIAMMSDAQTLEVVALNRDNPKFPYYITSIDVKASRKVDMTNPKNRGRNVTTYGRINLSAPTPLSPHLSIREESESTFTENFGSPLKPLKPGRYILRLEGQGVIHHGEITVGSNKQIVGLDNKGNISHKANNVLARAVIGDTPPIDLRATKGSSQDHVNKKGCDLEVGNDLNPASGQTVTQITAQIFGVNNANLSIDKVLYVGAEAEPLADTGAPVCAEACGVLTQAAADGGTSEFAAGLDRALTSNGKTDFFEPQHTTEINSKRGRGIVCSNYDLTAQEIKKRSGKSPSELRRTNPDLYSKLLGEAMPLKQFVAYMAPSCKREVVGLRQGCGCFEEKTSIQMADGSSKLAAEIRAGDLVFNPKTGRPHMIRKVIAGPERWPLLEVKAGGKSVTVTGEHPFLTKLGLKPAYKLTSADILIEGDAETQVEAVIAEERALDAKAPEVWNFELVGSSDPDDHYVLANGVMTGDLYLQQKLGNQGAASRKIVSE